MLGSSRSPLGAAGPAPLISRLRLLAQLSREDEAVLAGLGDCRWEPAGMEFVRDALPLNPRILVAGWAARVRHLKAGRRQIISFILPGDGIGLCRSPQPLALCRVVALTPIQTLDARPIVTALSDQVGHRGLAIAIDMAAALDQAWLIDQTVRLGRLTAYERVAHLMLELRSRLSSIGMDGDGALPFPLTQEMIGDATGLSIVHVNRTLQQLRRENLIEISHGQLRVLDVSTLQSISDFREPGPDTLIFDQ